MDTILLSRIQFGVTIAFHYIFPPLSIGLGLLLVAMEGAFLITKNQLYHLMTRFWVRIFGLIFAMGVATGIVMEFQFGTNWSNYSRFVGDVFGSALAAEGIFAFFLESGFLAILLFGWEKVKPGIHFLSTVMVMLGSHFSAVWILIANSWMQTPAGYKIVEEGGRVRAEVTDFWQVVFNPSSMDRLWHTVMGCWQAGGWLVISVAAFYLLKKKHTEFATASLKFGVVFVMLASILQLVSGHESASGVAEHQPIKLAAFEGHYDASAPAAGYFFGWVDEKSEKVTGLGIDGLTSFLVTGDWKAPIPGLNSVPVEDRPPVNLSFQAYHLMVAIGMGLIGLSVLTGLMMITGKLNSQKWLLWLLVLAVLGPQAANQLGWMAAELGRQPWIVYGLMRTPEGISPSVSAGEVLTSLIGFGFVYLLLFALFIFLLDQKIKHGPGEDYITEGVRA